MKALTPRRHRMKRAARLASARAWLATFEGKHVVRAYAGWFRVEHLCAVRELRTLGVHVDPAYEARLRQTSAARSTADTGTETRKQAAATCPREVDDDLAASWDLAFVAGTTSGGLPYGVPIEADTHRVDPPHPPRRGRPSE